MNSGIGRAAGVFEALAGLEQRLCAHHPEAAHLLHQALRIGDDPVTADELRRDAAGVAQRDGVSEDVSARGFVRLLGEVLRGGRYIDGVDRLVGHGRDYEARPRRSRSLRAASAIAPLQSPSCICLKSVKLGYQGQAPRSVNQYQSVPMRLGRSTQPG